MAFLNGKIYGNNHLSCTFNCPQEVMLLNNHETLVAMPSIWNPMWSWNKIMDWLAYL